MAKKHSLRAFTLIELVVVMALIVTLAGLATVSFVRSVEGRKVDHFAKELSSFLRFLQFKAIEEGKAHKISIDSTANTLTAFYEGKERGVFDPLKHPFSNRFSREKNFQLQFNEARDIYFFPDGTVTKGTIKILENGQESATIEIRNRVGAFKISFPEK